MTTPKADKISIVLDADVIIHFVKADSFALLLDIFPEYQYLVLDKVYEEVSKSRSTRTLLDNYFTHLPRRIRQESFEPDIAMMKEYARLLKVFGKGESACMVYCFHHKKVLSSSNLKDIRAYCIEHDITYLTTIDFLYFAFIRKKITKEGCDAFIQKVLRQGSKLPLTDISTYSCKVIL